MSIGGLSDDELATLDGEHPAPRSDEGFVRNGLLAALAMLIVVAVASFLGS